MQGNPDSDPFKDIALLPAADQSMTLEEVLKTFCNTKKEALRRLIQRYEDGTNTNQLPEKLFALIRERLKLLLMDLENPSEAPLWKKVNVLVEDFLNSGFSNFAFNQTIERLVSIESSDRIDLSQTKNQVIDLRVEKILKEFENGDLSFQNFCGIFPVLISIESAYNRDLLEIKKKAIYLRVQKIQMELIGEGSTLPALMKAYNALKEIEDHYDLDLSSYISPNKDLTLKIDL